MRYQRSGIGFGSDATVLAGYVQRANDRLGSFDLILENTGDNTLTLQVKEYVPSSNSYTNLGSSVTVVPRGNRTISFDTVSKKIGFFGSGNTLANISIVMRNPADLRGAQIDIVACGRRGWSFDKSFNQGTLTKNWGAPPDSLNTAAPSGGEGNG